MKTCESIPEPHASVLTAHTHSAYSVVSVQYSAGQVQCPTVDLWRQKCDVDKSCDETKENQQTVCTVDTVVRRENGSTTHMTNVTSDHLSSYGFNAADWLDSSFTDENLNTNTVKPLSSPVAGKDNKSPKSCFKIYKDSEPAAQNAIGHTSRNSNTGVLCDRTNIVHRSLQMSTKKTLPVTKGIKENHKPTSEKTYGVFCTQGDVIIDRGRNSEVSNVMSACQQGLSAKICSVSSHVSIVALSSASVTRVELSSSNTVAKASCQLSSFVSSSVAILTSPAVMTATVGICMSVPSSITFASPLSSVPICSSLLFSESANCRPVGSIQSFTSSSAVPKLFPSSVRTPQNQSLVRSSCSAKFLTPGILVTPCNQPVQNSTMRPTPPMCNCGCRAKRKFVQSPGQNMGRPFYCCGASKKMPRSGCNFFKWENSLSFTPFVRSSEVTPLSTKQSFSVQTRDGTRYYNTPLSNHIKQAASSRILVPPSLR